MTHCQNVNCWPGDYCLPLEANIAIGFGIAVLLVPVGMLAAYVLWRCLR